MPDTVAPRPARGVRTRERPMAFSVGEFVRGALLALGIFVVASGPVTALSTALLSGQSPNEEWLLSVVVTIVVAVVVSLVAVIPGAAIALGVGLLLRGVRARAVHVVAFLLVGLLVGFGAVAAVFGLAGFSAGGDTSIAVTAVLLGFPWILLCAAGVVVGWAVTSSLALRGDRRAAATTPGAPQPAAPQPAAPQPASDSDGASSSERSPSASS